ncbi:MAG: hypothetical protein CXT67_03060 [Methanobacteriota archaeon]|nr:MAG: hypothetical protein CXT67_03060 [Euryarchaeota archaeon]
MPLSQEQQLDVILTTYGPIIGMILVLLGVSLTLAGPRLLPLLTAWALFVPFALTAGAVVYAFLGVDPKIAIWVGVAIGMMAGVSGASIGENFHYIIGGSLGMGVMAVILSLIVDFSAINWIYAAIGLDISFIIGARLVKNMKEPVTFVGSASLGGISLAAGVTITSVGMQGLENFDSKSGMSAIIIVVCIIVGSLFQQWRYGDQLD